MGPIPLRLSYANPRADRHPAEQASAPPPAPSPAPALAFMPVRPKVALQGARLKAHASLTRTTPTTCIAVRTTLHWSYSCLGDCKSQLAPTEQSSSTLHGDSRPAPMDSAYVRCCVGQCCFLVAGTLCFQGTVLRTARRQRTENQHPPVLSPALRTLRPNPRHPVHIDRQLQTSRDTSVISIASGRTCAVLPAQPRLYMVDAVYLKYRQCAHITRAHNIAPHRKGQMADSSDTNASVPGEHEFFARLPA